MNPDSSSVSRRHILLAWLDWSNEDKRKTLIVATLLSLVCSLLVATAAVVLKPKQIANKQAEIKRNIIAVANLDSHGGDIDALFRQFVEVRLVDLASGEFIDHPEPAAYDWRASLNDPARTVPIDPTRDIARIKRLPKVLPVYLVRQHGKVRRVILPVYGYGLWSTLYGFVALEPNLQTVGGLRFYEHAETPGLGGEVDNPQWRRQWQGKKIYGPDGKVRLTAIRGHVKPGSPEASFQVDGLSGATLTTRGVNNLLHFWLSEQGFGKVLAKLKEAGL